MIGNSTQFDKTMAKEKALLQHAFEAMTNADLNCFTWSFYYVSESELDRLFLSFCHTFMKRQLLLPWLSLE